MHEVVFVSPPFASGNWPSLKLGILKSILSSHHIDSIILHANLRFKRKIDERYYEKLCGMFNDNDAIEIVFADAAFPEEADKHRAFLQKLKNKNKWRYERIIALSDKTEQFVEETADEIVSMSPGMVVIQAFMKQLTSSIAICRSLKRKRPGIITVVFGEDYSHPAGSEICRVTGDIDYILDGDPENNIVDLYCGIAGKFSENDAGMKPGGIAAHRRSVIKCRAVEDMDSLPFPDYSDYFRELDSLWFKYVKRTVCVESSRGCRHGEAEGCLFCGHGNKKAYRLKSGGRFIEEIGCLVNRYEAEQIQAEDYIMPADYPETVFKGMSQFQVKNIFYEVSPDTGLDELRIMKAVGMNVIQPGIESLNDDMLKTLNKRNDAAGNIRFLRDCKIAGIKPLWNMIYGVPGDKEHDYAEMIGMMPAISHLNPPASVRPIYLQKDSPLLLNAGRYGLKGKKPYEVYEHIFPEGADAGKIAMFFNAEYETAFSDPELKQCFFKSIKSWKKTWESHMPCLTVSLDEGRCVIIDTRTSGEGVRFELNDRHIALLEEMFIPADAGYIERFAHSTNSIDELKALVDKNILLYINGKYISLLEYEFP